MKRLLSLMVIMTLVLGIAGFSLAEDDDEDTVIYLEEFEDFNTMNGGMFHGINVPDNYQLPEGAPETGCCIVYLDKPGQWLQIDRNIVNISESAGRAYIVYNGEIIRTSLLDWEVIDTVVREEITLANGDCFEIHWFRKHCLEAEHDEENGIWRIWDENNDCVVEYRKGFISLSHARKFYEGVTKEMGLKCDLRPKYKNGKVTMRDFENNIEREHQYSGKIYEERIVISVFDLVEDVNLLVYTIAKKQE